MRLRLVDDIRRLLSDAGLSTRDVGAATGLDHGHVARIARGEARPSIETYARLAAALGADLSARLYPNTGPQIHDRHQAQMLEFLLGRLHRRWDPLTEVTVRHPARGTIDVVLRERRESLLIAAEIQSELRRLEQLVRWSHEKAESMPSSRVWATDDQPGSISRLLLVRRTRATRRIASEFARQLAVAFPAHPDDAVEALTGIAPWPGAALVWVSIEGDRVRFVRGR